MNVLKFTEKVKRSRSRAKYRNIKTWCLSKHKHDSRLEADYCNRLLAMKQSGEIVSFRIQVPFNLAVSGLLICVHVVDFLVAPKGWGPLLGKQGLEAHEVKGFETDAWKLKRNLFKVIYPDIKYIVIKKGKRNDQKFLRQRERAD